MKKFTNKNPNIEDYVLENIPGSVDDEWNVKSCLLIYNKGLNTELASHSVISSGGVDLGTIQSTKKKEEEKETTPLKQGGYEGAADVVGAATYIPTAHMYTDMFNKIGQAAMDIESNIKNKKSKEQQQKDLAAVEAGTMTQAQYDLKYPKAKTQKYKENKDGTFSLIT